MTQQVYQSNKQRPSEILVPMITQAVGSYYGGPAGGAAAGMAGQAAVGSQSQGAGQVPQSAAERRMGRSGMELQTPDNSKAALEEARMALASQPPEVQQEYAAPIMAALMKQRREEQAQQSLVR